MFYLHTAKCAAFWLPLKVGGRLEMCSRQSLCWFRVFSFPWVWKVLERCWATEAVTGMLVSTFWYRPASIFSFVKSATLLPGIWMDPKAPGLPCPLLQLESRHTLETPRSQWMQADACLQTKPLNQAHTQTRGISNGVGLGLCWSIACPTFVKIYIYAQLHID